MGKRWDIFGIGVAAVDDLVYVKHYPEPDEKMAMTMTRRQGGGLTATALIAASRQGAKTIYGGRLGDDELSRFTYDEFEREGVDTSIIQHTPGSKPFHAIIIVDISSGSRTIIYNGEGVAEPDLSAIPEDIIVNSRVLFIDHFAYHVGTYAADIAHSHAIPVVADIENSAIADLYGYLRKIDHLIVNVKFASEVTGISNDVEQMVRALTYPERAACIVTAGDKGCWYSEHGGEVFHFPAFSVKVVDTTGCGDVFHGAYAAALARGETVNRAVKVASATAALKATHPGGREGIPGLATVENFLIEASGQRSEKVR